MLKVKSIYCKPSGEPQLSVDGVVETPSGEISAGTLVSGDDFSILVQQVKPENLSVPWQIIESAKDKEKYLVSNDAIIGSANRAIKVWHLSEMPTFGVLRFGKVVEVDHLGMPTGG